MKKNYFLAILLFCCTLLSYAQDNKTIIATYMGANLNNLELSLTDLTDFKILSEGTLSNKEFKTAYLQQEINKIPVAGTSATVLIKEGQILKFNHAFVPNIRNQVTIQTATLSPKDAAKLAIESLGLSNKSDIKIIDSKTNTDIRKADIAASDMSAQLYYYKALNGEYVLVYEFVIKEGGSHWWITKTNATTGNLEHKGDAMITCTFGPKVETDNLSDHSAHSHKMKTSSKLVKKANQINFQASNKNIAASIIAANEASYVAFPLGIETPAHGERTRIVNPAVVATIPADAVVPSPLGWHNLGDSNTSRTEGNNVAAYEDANDINGPQSPGSFAETTKEGSLKFDYPIDLIDPKGPSTYTKAATVNLFVWNNYMHDISYIYGFDETNGNFQEDDYDRFNGPNRTISWNGDSVNAEAQDGAGLNNANFGTGSDGGNPTMQMFLWGASPFGKFFHVIDRSGAPTTPILVRSYDASRFPFFPIPRNDAPDNLPESAKLVLVEDNGLPYINGANTGESPDTSDGCTQYTAENSAAVSGNIAVVRRGACTFVDKIKMAESNGAIGVVIVNNVPGDGPVNGGGEVDDPITIPTVSISYEDGEALITAIEDEEIMNAVLRDDGPASDLIQRDGDLDQGIIAHEYGHGISTRLVGGRLNFACLISLVFEEQMGEGWSDFLGLVTTQKITDTEADARGIGTYVQFQGNDGAGIRPVRYSTDMTINDYTYVHLPAAERGLSVPHGIGFVWSTILWDMYWELINKHGFDSDLYYGTGGNNIALQLVMDGLKLSTCSNVGFVDGRDAILAADAAIYDGENECLIRSVFARRGVGALAAQGTSESREDQVPDFSVNPIGLNACEERVLAIADENKTIFSVYPNPTADEIYINNSRNIGSAVYKIVDLNGRVIQTNTITLTNGSKINTSRLSSGMYILTLKTNSGEVFSQKIIKK
jgi:extracellular elastinolytic metalloproteinase